MGRGRLGVTGLTVIVYEEYFGKMNTADDKKTA